MSSRSTHRASPFLNGSPSTASVTGLSLFHDNGRSRLLDDLTVLCGDIKFPVLSKAKQAMIKKCGPVEKSKPTRPSSCQESSAYSTLRRIFLCRSPGIESSFFDEEKQLQQSSYRLMDLPWADTTWRLQEKAQARSRVTSVGYSSSTSSGRSSDSGKSSCVSSAPLAQKLDVGRIFHPAPLCRRRAMSSLWIDVDSSRIYLNNSESRCARNGSGSFPSSPETLMLGSSTSPAGFSGIEVEVDGLGECHQGEGTGRFKVKKPNSKWNGNWV